MKWTVIIQSIIAMTSIVSNLTVSFQILMMNIFKKANCQVSIIPPRMKMNMIRIKINIIMKIMNFIILSRKMAKTNFKNDDFSNRNKSFDILFIY